MTTTARSWSSALMDPNLQAYYASLYEQIERTLHRPVIAAGVYQHAGVVSGMVVHKVSPLVALAMRRRASAAAAELPRQVILAVTADEVVVLGTDGRPGEMQPADLVDAWHRDEVRVVRAHDGSLYRRLVLQLGDRTVELDGTKDALAHRIEEELSR